MAEKLPYMQFYVGDWLKDPAVSRCSPATRGILFDLLCAMHVDDRSGRLRGTHDELSRIARCSTDALVDAINEIRCTGAADVTFCNGSVTVTNRRMRREFHSRKSTRKRVAAHRKRSCNGACNTKVPSDVNQSQNQSQKKQQQKRTHSSNTKPTPDPAAAAAAAANWGALETEIVGGAPVGEPTRTELANRPGLTPQIIYDIASRCRERSKTTAQFVLDLRSRADAEEAKANKSAKRARQQRWIDRSNKLIDEVDEETIERHVAALIDEAPSDDARAWIERVSWRDNEHLRVMVAKRIHTERKANAQ